MKHAVLVALAVAVALAFGTWWSLRAKPGGRTEPVAWLAGLSESSIDAMEFSWGRAEDDVRIVRDPALDAWMMERGTGATGVRWPVNPAALRGALRLLAEMGNLRPSEGEVMVKATPTRIVLIQGGARLGALVITPNGLGGQTPAIIEGEGSRFVLVEEAVGRLFLREGVVAWRMPTVFPREGLDPSQVRLSNSKGAVVLSRAQGRWAMSEPWVTPANDGAVKQLLASLAALPIGKFADDAIGDEAMLGLAKPNGTIRVETSLRVSRGAEVERRTLVEEIVVGGAADVARTSLFVRVEAKILDERGAEGAVAWGPMVAVVERSWLDGVAGDAGAYASRAAVRAAAADVTAATIRVHDEAKTTYSFKRRLDGWAREQSIEPTRRTLDSTTERRLTRFIELLCGERAERVFGEIPTGARAVTTIELFVGDGPLPVVEQLIDEGSEARPMLFRTGSVLRSYGEADRGIILESIFLGER